MTQPKFKGKYRVESTRLPNQDYATNGWYFVTICTRDRTHFFGNIVEGQVQLSAIGEIAQWFWIDILNHFEHTYINGYVIMPNHVHGIIVIDRPHQVNRDRPPNVETLQCNVSTRNQFMSNISPQAGSLGTIMRSYKSAVSYWCHQNGYDHFAWQPRFYEHIIRADGSLNRIRDYIANNPTKWELDRHNPTNLWM
ncbi:MAG TPA: transposase [Cyanobacteria bacterium UBA11370]|nr:transposase [Cyanobacteria bacterium UBA11370]HBY79536.1 transposase [Cyanobacteria bacterium UBA11148]